MKNEALEALCASYEKPALRFNALLAIYGKCENNNRNVLQHLNRTGYTPGSLNELEYELKRFLNIREVDVINFKKSLEKETEPTLLDNFNAFLTSLAVDLAFKVILFLKLKSQSKYLTFPPGSTFEGMIKDSDLEPFFAEVNNQETQENLNVFVEKGILEDDDFIKTLNSKEYPEDIAAKVAALFDLKSTSEENPFLKAPDEVKEAIKLRDEFPFLKAADCPQVAFVLVGEKINAYEQFIESHSELISKLVIPALEGKETPEDKENAIFELAKAAVDGFVVDQLIWDELNAYKETGKFLGVHELTKEKDEKPINQYSEISAVELTKKLAAAKNSMNRNKSKLEKEKDPLKAKSYKEKVEAYSSEIVLIQQALESKQ